MAKLRADKKNFKRAFKKHIHACDNWHSGSDNSKRVIMCYCVECGLKYLIMEENKIYRTSQAQDDISDILGSHDFRKLLKAVKKSGTYRFEAFQTEFDQTVTAENYHQVCRYCIEEKDKGTVHMEKYDDTLNEIAEWLKEVI